MCFISLRPAKPIPHRLNKNSERSGAADGFSDKINDLFFVIVHCEVHAVTAKLTVISLEHILPSFRFLYT